LEKDKLSPGDSLDLEIIFSTRTYLGLVAKHPAITVIENDADTVTKFITLTVNVFADPDSAYPIRISPYKLDISQFGSVIRNHIDFDIKNVSEMTVHPRLVDYPNNLFVVNFPPEILPGESASGSVTLTEEAIAVDFEKSITIEIDDISRTRFTIPVKRTIHIIP